MNVSMPIPLPPKAVETLLPYTASEGGHWYDQDGNPVYQVTARDGSMRDTTLRDARKLNLFPSVTGIMRCADAPALNIWKQRQLLMSSLTLPRLDGEDTNSFADRIIADAAEQGKAASDLGTIIHGCIEQSLCGDEYDPTYTLHVAGALKALNDWCGLDDIVAEKSFAHPFGFGGKVDAHKPWFVGDYKSKDFDEGKLPRLYENHAMQLSAYRNGLGLPTARCAIIFVSTRVPGLTHLVEIEAKELDRGWEMFKALLKFWQHKNQYTPKFTRGEK